MNRKGSAILEATLVFPVVLFTLMALVGIQVFLFKDASAQASLHQTLRTEAGRETHTYSGKSVSSQVVCNSGFEGIIRTLHGEIAVTFDGSFALLRKLEKTLEARVYLIDERKYARLADFFTGNVGKDGHGPEHIEE